MRAKRARAKERRELAALEEQLGIAAEPEPEPVAPGPEEPPPGMVNTREWIVAAWRGSARLWRGI